MVKASDVPRLMVEKRIEGKHSRHYFDDNYCYVCKNTVDEDDIDSGGTNYIFNKAVTEIGSKTLKLKREETAKRLHKIYYAIFMLPSEWEDLMDFRQEMFMEQADNLNASLKDLLVAE